MTDAFRKFLIHYNSHGRDYGDGYAQSCFTGLSEEEIDQVTIKLLERAKKGDSIAIDGMGKIIPLNKSAIVELEKIIQSVELETTAHIELGFVLWKATGDQQWQDEIIKSLKSSNVDVKKRAVVNLVLLANTQPSEELKKVFINELLNSTNSLIKSECAEGIALCYGLPPFIQNTTPNRIALENRLISANFENIEKILSEVNNFSARKARIFPY